MIATMLDMEDPEEPKEIPKFLKSWDRCDQGCGAQASVIVETDSGSQLIFCGHHYNQFEPNLYAVAHRIFDERE